MYMHFITVAAGNRVRMARGYVGACLDPRIGSDDLNMWLQVGIPWIIVFFMSVSGVRK